MKHLLVATVLAALVTGAARASDDAAPVTTFKTHSTARKYAVWCALGPTIAGIGVSAATGGKAGDVGVSLSLAGLVFGPGSGHLYAGNTGRFALGAGIRFAALLAGGLLAESSSRDKTWQEGLGLAVLWGGLGLTVAVGSAIYDIKTTGRSVNRCNESRRRASVALSPAWFADQDAAGLIMLLRL